MLQWFKNHPEFLRRESSALSNDSNYKEIIQCRDNLFISHGHIIIRLNEVHHFPILIIYTDATPYRLPLIFPLQSQLSLNTLNELAALSLEDAVQRIKPSIQFYYHLRHQNSSGELCTLEREDLDAANNFYGISTILQRVRDWCAGHITHNYPPDSEEVNFIAHFNFINTDTRLFYPDHFLNEDLIEGDCYAALFKFISQGIFFTEDKYVYLGIYLDGVGKNGLFEQSYADLSRYKFHEKLKTSLDLYTQPAMVNQLIAEKQLLKAHWFRIANEPLPFHSLKDLVEIIGNGNYLTGIQRLAARCLESFKLMPDTFFLGLRFPNRKSIDEFQLFKIYKSKSAPAYVMHINLEEKMQAILEQYDKVEAIESEKLSEDSFHQRNSKRANHTILKNATVNLLGLGAIGSEIADCMAKAGTGSLVLYDDQTLKAHNAVRHLAGMDQVGMPKVTAVAEILNNHNPFIRILPYTLNLYNLDGNKHIFANSVSISSIADDNAEGFINQQLVIANKTAFYVRALRGGKVARIIRVIPGKDACFNCLSLYRNEGKEFIEIPEDPAYPTLKNECNNPIRPASAADLKFIASLASRILINHLQDKEVDTNHWIWSSEIIEGSTIQTPNYIHSQCIPIHSDCIYCHNENQKTVSISSKCISFMQELIKKNPKIETGGIIAGKVDDKGNIIITDVSGPGPKAIQTPLKFEKDITYCQHFLDELYKKSKQKTIYVGEWHSHPSKNNQPSETDIQSLSEIAVEKNYLTNCPAMIIFSNTGLPSCTVHPFGMRYYFKELIILENE